jgi:glycosyltransferase involved in cell wall biosynthesis
MKLLKAGKMFTNLGHQVILYSGEENEAPCYEHVQVFSKKEREKWYGVHDQNTGWGHADFDPMKEPWAIMNSRALAEIHTRIEPTDLVLLIAGLAQKPIADGLYGYLSCEWGVGYEGIFSHFCAFESNAWRHYLYGKYAIDNGRWYDTVIPNFFDTNDFHLGPKSDYLLFVGRIIERKGYQVAVDIAERAGRRLIVAGPGGENVEWASHVEYVGPVDLQTRSELMAGAVALLAPTLYLEPFGGVTVEAMLCGTPAVTSDWGAFPEIVEEGVTGYRFAKISDGVAAVEKAKNLSSIAICERAEKRFSLEVVGPQFDRWFRRLQGLYGTDDFYGAG